MIDLSQNDLKKYFARFVIGPAVGIARGVAGLVSINSLISGALLAGIYLATFGFSPAMTMLTYGVILPLTISAYKAYQKYGLDVNKIFDEIRKEIKNIVTYIKSLYDKVISCCNTDFLMANLPYVIFSASIIIFFGLPLLGMAVSVAMSVASLIINTLIANSLISAFVTGVALYNLPNIAYDLAQILNHLFIKEETSSEYIKAKFENGPVIGGIAAGVLAADVFGANYDITNSTPAVQELFTFTWNAQQIEVNKQSDYQWTVSVPRVLGPR